MNRNPYCFCWFIFWLWVCQRSKWTNLFDTLPSEIINFAAADQWTWRQFNLNPFKYFPWMSIFIAHLFCSHDACLWIDFHLQDRCLTATTTNKCSSYPYCYRSKAKQNKAKHTHEKTTSSDDTNSSPKIVDHLFRMLFAMGTQLINIFSAISNENHIGKQHTSQTTMNGRDCGYFSSRINYLLIDGFDRNNVHSTIERVTRWESPNPTHQSKFHSFSRRMIETSEWPKNPSWLLSKESSRKWRFEFQYVKTDVEDSNVKALTISIRYH